MRQGREGTRILRARLAEVKPETAGVRKVLLGPTGGRSESKPNPNGSSQAGGASRSDPRHAASTASSTDGCRPAPLLDAPDSAVRGSKSGKPAQVRRSICGLRPDGRYTN